jgi:hypothetical protein
MMYGGRRRIETGDSKTKRPSRNTGTNTGTNTRIVGPRSSKPDGKVQRDCSSFG